MDGLRLLSDPACPLYAEQPCALNLLPNFRPQQEKRCLLLITLYRGAAPCGSSRRAGRTIPPASRNNCVRHVLYQRVTLPPAMQAHFNMDTAAPKSLGQVNDRYSLSSSRTGISSLETGYNSHFTVCSAPHWNQEHVGSSEPQGQSCCRNGCWGSSEPC